jgi:hypothetical protein
MNMLDYARLMSRYNRWMNEKLYDACEFLDDDMRRENRSAPFTSIHGTLNHLLLADRLWIGRFTGVLCSYESLGQELYANWNELRRERCRTDDDIERWSGYLRKSHSTKFCNIVASSPGAICRCHMECALCTSSIIKRIIAASLPRCWSSAALILASQIWCGCRTLKLFNVVRPF